MHDFRIGQQRFGKPGPMEGVLEDLVLPMNEPLDCSRCWIGREIKAVDAAKHPCGAPPFPGLVGVVLSVNARSVWIIRP